MGYAGGTKANPTYYDLGDHSETIQIEYDPSIISYEQLLEVFWEGHDPTAARGSVQYRSAILYHGQAQRDRAEKSRDLLQERFDINIATAIEPLEEFYLAEDYHQKFRLRNLEAVDREYRAIYPELVDYVNSTAIMRVNAFLGGYGTVEDLEAIEDQLGLSADALEILRQKLVQLGWVIDCI